MYVAEWGVYLTDTLGDWDLGNMEVLSWAHAPAAVPEQFLKRGRMHCSAGNGCSHLSL